MARLTAVAVAVVVAAVLWHPDGLVLQFAEGTALTVAYGALTWAMVLGPDERRALRTAVGTHSLKGLLAGT